MAGTATILRAAVSYSGSRTSPLATNVSTNVHLTLNTLEDPTTRQNFIG